MRLRPRLLNVLILAAGATLAVKVGLFWHDAGIAFAQTATGETAAKPAPAPTPTPAAPTPAPAAAHGALPSAAEGEALKPGPMASAPIAAYSDTEVKLLQELAKRRAELDQRADQLNQRETLLKAAEARVDEKIDQLKQIQNNVNASLGKLDAQEDERLASLVAIYTNMKPKEAATILADLKMPVLLQIMTRMKDRTSSAILGQMDPKRAQEITLAVAEHGKTAAVTAGLDPTNVKN